jgi:hypothetical protein
MPSPYRREELIADTATLRSIPSLWNYRPNTASDSVKLSGFGPVEYFRGKFHKKVNEIRPWGVSLGHNLEQFSDYPFNSGEFLGFPFYLLKPVFILNDCATNRIPLSYPVMITLRSSQGRQFK